MPNEEADTEARESARLRGPPQTWGGGTGRQRGRATETDSGRFLKAVLSPDTTHLGRFEPQQ